jgi:hypothetical protein
MASNVNFYLTLPWQPGVAVIVSANGTEYRGFESRRGVRFLGLHMYNALLFFET